MSKKTGSWKQIPEKQWEETFKEGHRITNSPTWREFEWKVKMPLHSIYYIKIQQYNKVMLERMWYSGLWHLYILGLPKVN